MYTVHRSKYNPLLQPSVERSWESIATLNGCPIKVGDELHMVYRAIGKPDLVFSPHIDNSIIAITSSKDGNTFGPTSQLIVPTEDFDKYGCEDPRVTYFEGKYYIFYTALSVIPFQASGIKIAVAVSDDLKTIQQKHLVTPFNAKAMTLFPERVNGKVTAIFSIHTDQPPANMVIVQAQNIEDLWSQDFWDTWYKDYKDKILFLDRNDQDHCEVGAPPVLTDDGWLLVYSHTQHYFDESKRLFGIEAILLDRNDPFKVIGRTHSPIIVPEASYERYGLIKNITFPSGAILHDNGKLDIYYGAADTVCARASVSVRDLISSMKGEYKSFMARSFDNPILRPIAENNFEGRAVFNPASIEIDGVFYIIYRAMSMDNTSTMGLAVSHDGRKITERLDYPIYGPREDFEQKKVLPDGNSGCEDPRVTRVGDTLYMLYTGYNGITPPAVAITHISIEDFVKRRFENWSKPHLLSPSMIDDKDACIVPGKFPNGHLVFHRINHQICADFIEDINNEAHMLNRCIEILRPRYGMWDELKVGIAGPPLKTDAGWLLFYHGVSSNGIYRVGAALLDKDDPTYVVSRLSDPVFEPVEDYELVGQINNVVFPCGAIVRDDTIYMYYGGADSVVGLATCSLSKLLTVLLPKELQEN